MTVDVVTPYSGKHTSYNLLKKANHTVRTQCVKTNHIVISDSKCKGPAWARNKGLKKSDNRFVAFLDADDWWTDREKLKKQVKLLKENDAGICVAGIDNRSEKDFVKDLFLSRLAGLTSGIVIDTEKVDLVFDESIYRREDHLFILEAISEAGLAILESDCYSIGKEDSGLSNTEDYRQKLVAEQKFLNKAVSIYGFLSEFTDEFYSTVYHRAGRTAYFNSDFDYSREYLKTSLKFRRNPKTVAAFAISTFRGVMP